MGIPHLITFLQPYAESESLVGGAVIDGPGLAYHIFYLCLNSRASVRYPFETALSYEELGDACLEWLDGLRESGVDMCVSYADTTSGPELIEYTEKRYTSTVTYPLRSSVFD